MALLITLVMLAILTGATLALATLATGDIEIAAADRMGTLAFNISETGVDEVLSDANIGLAPGAGGFAPDPGDTSLSVSYTAPRTSQLDANYVADIQYLRQGPVEESSALAVRSIVYNVSVTGSYVRAGTSDQLAKTSVNSEFYRIAPKTQGVVSKARHYQ